MKKITLAILATLVLSLVLGACGGNKEAAPDSKVPPKDMVDKLIQTVEQPAQMELDKTMVEATYHFNPDLLEAFSIRVPLMNVKTNEIAILKVKSAKDLSAVETGVKQRAADVQKVFESYLPDQYENAKNYKLVTKGNYVLFVISENADELVKTFDSYFAKQ
ncbi:DUF4358 domain-containing protein [Gorillibacterium massiliense]|uniref:DUF4358 domain-containing protein n=1 Tax=Gorillibacterium massiliense TaxID=1280390 RepID=UPI0004BAD1B3|nr:DUF4358 domain-containing protein [Gorillibacterium massiliense]